MLGKLRSKRNRINLKLKNKHNYLRVSIFKSNRFLYLQLIDDINAVTLLQSNDLKTRSKLGSRHESAVEVGLRFGKLMIKNGYSRVIFDRGRYKFIGIVKTVVDSIRESGIII